MDSGARSELVLELEVDAQRSSFERYKSGSTADADHTQTDEDIVVVIRSGEQGHGFGLSEVLTISVSAAATVTSKMIVESILQAVGRNIRRAKGKTGRSDGRPDSLASLLDKERSRSD